jgi:hypothetical protein
MSSPAVRAGAGKRVRRSYFGMAEIGLAAVVAGLAALALTGTGLPRPMMAVAAPLVWVADGTSGRMSQVDPQTGRVEARLRAGRAGELLEVAQQGSHLAVVNDASGGVLMLDSGTLTVTGQRPGLAGGVRVLLTDSAAYLVELARGVVRRVDPSTMEDVGAPLETGRSIVDAAVGVDGALSMLLPDGSVQSVRWSERSERLARAAATGPVALADSGRSTVVLAGGERVAAVAVGELGCAQPWRPTMFRDILYVSCRGAGRVLVLTAGGQPVGPAIALAGSPQPVRYDGGLLLAGGDRATLVPESGDAARSLRFTDPGVVVRDVTDRR